MKGRLLWKLLGINALVIGLVVLVVRLAIDYRAAGYFVELGLRYDIAPESLHRMFLDSAHRVLLQAGLAAFALAGALSWFLTRRTLRPLYRMTAIAREFAAGDYQARVGAAGNDEVGELATAFDRMADSLARNEKLRKALVSDVAHELRTPLTNVCGYLEGLTDGVVLPGAEVFALLKAETARLAQLVDDLLDLSKTEAARTTLRRTPVDLAGMAAQVLDLFRLGFSERGIRVEADLDNAGEVPADAGSVARMLANLLENARRYTPPGGTVRLRAERLDGAVRLSVANSGPGIDPLDLPRIFERFFRGEKSRSREHGGTGVGLSIVKELAEAHGGSIEARSADGETRVAFTLPA